MTRDETIALFQDCEAARAEILASANDADAAHTAAAGIWNAWAEKLLALKEQLIRDNKWKLRTKEFGLSGENQETIDRLEDAHVNFSGYKFNDTADFRNFRFPGPTSFGPVCARADEEGEEPIIRRKNGDFFFASYFPGGDVEFAGEALFADTEFLGPANFAGAHFKVLGDFRRAIFNDDAIFYGSTFLYEGADFSSARFGKTASFSKATFKKSPAVLQYYNFAQFVKTKFDGEAHFLGAKFDGLTNFVRAQFFERANFNDAEFTEMANFNAAQFIGDAWFRAAKFNVAFFEDTTFSGASHFDGGAHFLGGAGFLQARFGGYTTFRNAIFDDAAVFRGIVVERVFDLDGVRFQQIAQFPCSSLFRSPPTRQPDPSVTQKIIRCGPGVAHS